MSKTLTVLAAALALTTAVTAANAAPFTQTVGDVTLTVTNLGVPTNDFGENVTGYTAYDVSLSTNDGSNITSMAFGGAGFTGFQGPLLQEWDYTVNKKGQATYSPTPDVQPNATQGGGLNGQDYGLDSHFLLNMSNFLVQTPPTEDNPALHNASASYAPGSPGDDGGDVWGIGTSLVTNVAGNGAANDFPSFDVAYLVIPSSGFVSYSFAATTDANGSPQSNFAGSIPSAVTPEPASLGLLAVGGMALLARRKRTI